MGLTLLVRSGSRAVLGYWRFRVPESSRWPDAAFGEFWQSLEVELTAFREPPASFLRFGVLLASRDPKLGWSRAVRRLE